MPDIERRPTADTDRRYYTLGNGRCRSLRGDQPQTPTGHTIHLVTAGAGHWEETNRRHRHFTRTVHVLTFPILGPYKSCLDWCRVVAHAKAGRCCLWTIAKAALTCAFTANLATDLRYAEDISLTIVSCVPWIQNNKMRTVLCFTQSAKRHATTTLLLFRQSFKRHATTSLQHHYSYLDNPLNGMLLLLFKNSFELHAAITPLVLFIK